MSETHIARRVLLSTCVIALVSACGDPVTAPVASRPSMAPNALRQSSASVDISGVWPYHEDATFLLFDYAGHATKAFRCSSDGTYTIVQTGDTFTGTLDQVGVCTAADGTTFPNNFSGSSRHRGDDQRPPSEIPGRWVSVRGRIARPDTERDGWGRSLRRGRDFRNVSRELVGEALSLSRR